MSGQEPGLRERMIAKVEAWFNSPDDLAANDEMAAQVTDLALAEVQAELAAKDARIAELEAELEEATLAHQAAETWRERNLKAAQDAIELMNAAAAERDRLRAELLTWLPRLGAHLDLGPEHDPMAMAMLGGTVKLAMKALYAALDQAPAEEASGT